MPEQRTIGADMRSILATGRGVPWWGAVLIAVTATLIGTAVEAGSGHDELGGIFAMCYALGCLAAVLTVRQSGIFTAITQPPLLLFVAVPLAYYLMHESSFSGMKDIAITCGYPLIERFPLMLFTSSAVLLVGLVRWYLAGRVVPQTPSTAGSARTGTRTGLPKKPASAGTESADEDRSARTAPPRHVAERPGANRSRRSQDRSTTRSRHSRQPLADTTDTPARRRAPRPAMGAEGAAPEPRRSRRERDRVPPERLRRDQPDQDRKGPLPSRRDQREHRDHHRDPIAPRPPRSRLEPYETGGGYQAHPHYGAYPPPPYQPPPYQPRRRSASDRGADDRHPVSRVRYRDSAPPESDRRVR